MTSKFSTIAILFLIPFTLFAGEFVSSARKLVQEISRDRYLASAFKSGDLSWAYIKGVFVYSLLQETSHEISASKFCDNQICFQFRLLHWLKEDALSIGEATKAFGGVSIIHHVEELPGGSFFVHYNGPGLKALSDRLFRIGKNDSNELSPGEIYSTEIKVWIIKRYELTHKILRQKEKFKLLSDEYIQKARSEKDFNGTDMTNHAASELGCSVYDTKTWKKKPGMECDERWVGMLLRRNIDGTLPVVLQILDRIVKLYDTHSVTSETPALN